MDFLLVRAARHMWSNQRELGRALRDARIPLDNNRARKCPPNVALGRKNFLFVHSEESGKELALLYSLVVSCTRVGVNPVEYLADVLDRIDKTAKGGYAALDRTDDLIIIRVDLADKPSKPES